MEEGKALMAHESHRHQIAGLRSEAGSRKWLAGAQERPGLWNKAQVRLCGIQVAHTLSLSRFHQPPESSEVGLGVGGSGEGVPKLSISWEHDGTALSTADHR